MIDFKTKTQVELIQSWGTEKTIVDSARVSIRSRYDSKETKPQNKRDKNLIRFLYQHKHTSPFEHVGATFYLQVPIFIARQIMRHRTFSYNEISRRYTDKSFSFYIPTELKKQAASNLQCSSNEGFTLPENLRYLNEMKQSTLEAYDLYQRLLKQEVSREYARMILPQNTMTEFYMSGNLNNWLKFLGLRMKNDVQKELIETAQFIAKELEKLYPETLNLFLEEHTRDNK